MARLDRDAYLDRLRRIRLLVTDVDGVWTRGDILYMDGDREAKSFYVRDGSAMYIARLIGVQTAVVTGRSSHAVSRRMGELPVDEVRQGVLDKIGACREIQRARDIADDEVAYVGDDLLDLPLMEKVGLGIAVADAHERVLEGADWVTRRAGGTGAVREIVDDIVDARGLWDEVLDEYRSKHSDGAEDANEDAPQDGDGAPDAVGKGTSEAHGETAPEARPPGETAG